MEKELNRVAKVIARSGVCSRRDAERKILAGSVEVNGKVIDSPALNVSNEDIIKVDGVELSHPDETRLFIYNKPVGLITSHRDGQGRPTVFEKLPPEYGRLLSVGRLDLNSEGLLLLTNDGEFQRFMESPKNEFERIYRVRVRGIPSKEDIKKLKSGITVDGVHYKSIDVKIEKTQSSNTWIIVKLTEGKNREIRRTMESLGYQVNRLIRISYAGLQLRNLGLGEIYEVQIPKKILELYREYKENLKK